MSSPEKNGAALDPMEQFETYPDGAIEAMELAERLGIEKCMRRLAELTSENRKLFTQDELMGVFDDYLDWFQELGGQDV